MKRIISKALAAAIVMSMLTGLAGCGSGENLSKINSNVQNEQISDEEKNEIKDITDILGEVKNESVTKAETLGLTLKNSSDRDSKTDTVSTLKGEASKFSFTNGKLNIERATRKSEKPLGKSGTWTILCYLCGTDLESEDSSATDDIDEMLAASASKKVNFIIQAGGTSEWTNSSIANGKITRMSISNGKLKILNTSKAVSLGSESTLENFLEWGIKKYPADNMGLIFWNHGAGSINGVCFDELFDSDSLSLTEIDNALSAVYDKMSERFEFIGFDACLMSTLETASKLVPHAKYMIASEELESGMGWDYTPILSYLSKHPKADGAELGKVICDSFFKANKKDDSDSMSTLAVTDLSRIDNVIQEFNTAAADIYNLLEDEKLFSAFYREAMKAEKYGGNNDSEGYSNMVDLGDIMKKCSGIIGNTEKVISAIENAIVYQVRGDGRSAGYGLSVFFPCSYSGEYVNILKDISVSPYYMAFCDKMSYLSAGDYSEENEENEYDDSMWLAEDGYWGDYNEEYEEYYDDEYYDYWDSEPEIYFFGEESDEGYISFDVLPELDEDGVYYFIVSPDSIDYIESVRCNISQWIDEDEVIIGTDNDVNCDWENGLFYDNFDGSWFSLPDGQNLCTYLIEEGENYDIYCSPVSLNGEDVYIRIIWDYDKNEALIAGVWEGIDSDTGCCGRIDRKIKEGDVIIPLYEAYTADDEYDIYEGDEYVFESDSVINYDLLDEGTYGYSFEIIDIYGNSYYSDYVDFDVEEDGSVSYVL